MSGLGILLRFENPKIGGIDDAEVVGDGIAVKMPVVRHFDAQEGQHGGAEFVEPSVTSVVGDIFVHQAP